MSDTKPPVVIDLTWEDALRFTASADTFHLPLDSGSKAGLAPMQLLAIAIAGCMAMDIVHIVKKGRHDLRGLKAHLIGRRASAEPRRFVAIDLQFEIGGAVPLEQVERAIALSRETYCSVWQSMRQDIEFRVTATVV
jgi:putative redox protein